VKARDAPSRPPPSLLTAGDFYRHRVGAAGGLQQRLANHRLQDTSRKHRSATVKNPPPRVGSGDQVHSLGGVSRNRPRLQNSSLLRGAPAPISWLTASNTSSPDSKTGRYCDNAHRRGDAITQTLQIVAGVWNLKTQTRLRVSP
jgi:hypothetical protein